MGNRVLIGIFFIIVFNLCFAQTVFTYRSPESPVDSRYDYDNALLKLSLEKTMDTDGEYILKPSPQMNFRRMNDYLSRGILTNPIFKQSATNDNCDEFDYINFPVDLGIVGYRVFFVAPRIKEEFEKVSTLEELRRYTIIQGSGWSDIEILKSAGLNVIDIPKYESLFIEIIKNRADLLSRGINEILDEMTSHQNLKLLDYNDNVVLYYPLPRFFFSSKGNEEALDRVRRGLLIAYEDGSLVDLWEEYYEDSILSVNLESRKVIKIGNPLVSRIDKSYEKYLYKY